MAARNNSTQSMNGYDEIKVEESLETVEDVISGASKHNAIPLWPQMVKFNPPAPNPRCVPHIWRYSSILPYLLRAGDLVKEKDAERRVLMLINPEREGPYTTDTLYAGLQLVMPNETAPAHRHTAFALRFIISGSGGFTAVHGRRIQMSRGDVILTPTWNWHDHGKDGSGPMIWLDGLDLPLFQFFPVHFVEHFSSSRYPATDIDKSQSPIVYPWATMKSLLDAAPGPWTRKTYRKRNGGYVSKTLSASAERLDGGTSSPARRETTSCVYHVISGKGHSVIGEQRFEWKEGDTFCVPSWFRYEHFAEQGAERVYLYRFDDRPVIEALGFYRWEGMNTESLVNGA
ncbi:RmlC-like cupin [Corynespora cassiicola Philippines]|uniref:RmlC-like cupin n=1 Tax=Corynespora cassiicola Philippines TaxID=1448308 RepID=A0A2T2N1N6_CORCC|nr:RmlC-like cupin [Corynespora cassiicola Philippines]